MAQSTPTHASGFQLFTVAMTGHAEEWVQLPQHKVAIDRCCPNAITKSRSERVDCVGMNKGVCLPGRSTGGHCSSDRYSRTLSGAGPIEEERCRKSNTSICNIMMHEHGRSM